MVDNDNGRALKAEVLTPYNDAPAVKNRNAKPHNDPQEQVDEPLKNHIRCLLLVVRLLLLGISIEIGPLYYSS